MTAIRSPLLRFILIRLAYTVAVLLGGVIVAVFFLIQIVPGDPVRIALGTRYTPESYAALRSVSGLDQPLPNQLVAYVAMPSPGISVSASATANPSRRCCSTGYRRPSPSHSPPSSWRCSSRSHWFVGGSPRRPLGRQRHSCHQPVRHLGPRLLDGHPADRSLLDRTGWLPSAGYQPFADGPLGWFEHLVLPAVTVGGVVTGAIMTRYVRSSVLEVVNTPFVTTAESKGLSRKKIMLDHVGRNALVPVLTISGIQLAGLLGGVIVVEVVFAWPGLGLLVYDSVAARDYPVLQGAILLIAVIFLFVNLVVDILYAVIDPRIRLS